MRKDQDLPRHSFYKSNGAEIRFIADRCLMHSEDAFCLDGFF